MNEYERFSDSTRKINLFWSTYMFNSIQDQWCLNTGYGLNCGYWVKLINFNSIDFPMSNHYWLYLPNNSYWSVRNLGFTWQNKSVLLYSLSICNTISKQTIIWEFYQLQPTEIFTKLEDKFFPTLIYILISWIISTLLWSIILYSILKIFRAYILFLIFPYKFYCLSLEKQSKLVIWESLIN